MRKQTCDEKINAGSKASCIAYNLFITYTILILL